jgi:hypothetical protein
VEASMKKKNPRENYGEDRIRDGGFVSLRGGKMVTNECAG